MSKQRVGIVDADTLVFAACNRSEVPIRWSETLWTLHSDFSEAVAMFEDDVDEILDAMQVDVVVMALSNYNWRWRTNVMPTYKQHREKDRKPVTFGPLRDYVHEYYRTFEVPGLEGDDVAGILLTRDDFYPNAEKIAISIDKDFKTLPGLHVNYQRGRDQEAWEPKLVTPAQADYYHMYQTLTGDRVDGYPGCKGIGPKRAEQALEHGTCAADWWSIVVSKYVAAGLGEADALLNARVARILRIEDWDVKKKEVRLWHPPKDGST